MAAQQIRLSQRTIDEVRKIGEEELKDFTDDKAVWTLCLEHRRMKTEIELLKLKLNDCENRNSKKEV